MKKNRIGKQIYVNPLDEALKAHWYALFYAIICDECKTVQEALRRFDLTLG